MHLDADQKAISDKDTILAVVLGFTAMVALAYSVPGGGWTLFRALVVGGILALCLIAASERVLVLGGALFVVSCRACVAAMLYSGHRFALFALAILFAIPGLLLMRSGLRRRTD